MSIHICHKTKLQDIAELQNRPRTILDIKGKRPVSSLQDLEKTLGNCPHKRAKWREEARIAVNSCHYGQLSAIKRQPSIRCASSVC